MVSGRQFSKLAITAWLCLTPLASVAQPAPPLSAPELDANRVVSRMLEMDQKRRAALKLYTATRQYAGDNRRFNKHAETVVEETYEAPSTKRFNIVSESGSGYIRRKVFSKLMEAETDAFSKDNLDQTRISPENYTFRVLRTERIDDRNFYVLELVPKKSKKYLMKGQIWVDREDFAIAKMEGQPAKNPSFWTRRVRIVRQYGKFGEFWLPVSTSSESDVFIAGKSTLTIQYRDYRINEPAKTGEARSPVPARDEGGN